MSPVLVIALIVLIGVIASIVYRRQHLKAPWTIMTYALLIGLGYGVIVHDRQVSTSGRRADQQAAQQKAHDDCMTAVDKRTQYRFEEEQSFDFETINLDITENLYDTIDAATGTTHYTSDQLLPGKPSLRQSLADQRKNLAKDRSDFESKTPAIDPATCPAPPGDTTTTTAPEAP